MWIFLNMTWTFTITFFGAQEAWLSWLAFSISLIVIWACTKLAMFFITWLSIHASLSFHFIFLLIKFLCWLNFAHLFSFFVFIFFLLCIECFKLLMTHFVNCIRAIFTKFVIPIICCLTTVLLAWRWQLIPHIIKLFYLKLTNWILLLIRID